MSKEHQTSQVHAIATMLDAFHLAAAQADGQAYFSHFATNGVFIGTDATERWTVEEFKKYANPIFQTGRGWIYISKSRHIDLSASGDFAWFDEILDSKTYGVSRGTGVIMKMDESWKIAQYHLTFPIPNALAAKFTDEIKNHLKLPTPTATTSRP